MKPAPFDWCPVTSLEEAVAALAADDDAKIIAGGQSLMPLLSLRLARPSTLVDLAGVDLGAVTTEEGPAGPVMVIGAMVRQRRLELEPSIRRAIPLLAEAASHVGYVATRNRGTLGGSLAHADPVAELPAVAVALGATVIARGPGGERRLRADELADGFFTTTLASAEVLVAVRFPVAGPRHGAAWCEWSARQHDFPDAGAGVAVELAAGGEVQAVMAAACGIGGGPLPLGEVLAGAGVTGAVAPTATLLRAVAAAVQAAAGSAPDGRDELCGLLAARALDTAMRRAASVKEPG